MINILKKQMDIYIYIYIYIYNKTKWIKWTALAACLAILITGFGLTNLLYRNFCGDGGYCPPRIDSYSLDLPLTTKDNVNDIELTREISYDLNLVKNHIQNKYKLTNTSSNDKIITLFYPFTSDVSENINKPDIKVNGKRIKASLNIGNLNNSNTYLENWKDYNKLLKNNSYFNSINNKIDADIPVTVYSIKDIKFPPQGYNSTLNISIEFTLDRNNTTVISNGFNGFRDKNNIITYSNSSLPGQMDNCLIVIGEPISNINIMGYNYFGSEKQVPNVSGRTEVRKSKLNVELQNMFKSSYKSKELDKDIAYSAFRDIVMADINEKENFIDLDEVDLLGENRLLYSSFEVKIPAKKTISVQTDKDVNYLTNLGIEDFGIATKLGSPFEFKSITTKLKLSNDIKILSQNMGYDVSKRKHKIEFDVNKDYYHIKISNKN